MATKYTIHSHSDFVIDSKCVEKLVPAEYKKFWELYENTDLESGDDYGKVTLLAREFVHQGPTDENGNPTISVRNSIPKGSRPSGDVPENMLKLAKALAKVKVAAYHKGVHLVVGYEYNRYRCGFRFGLPSNCYRVSVTKRGKEMLDILRPEDTPLLTSDVCFE